MPRILTLTMNPAIDVSTSVDRVIPGRKLRCREGRRDPGGGGINVARVARRLGAEAVAVYPTGGFTGRMFERLLTKEGVQSVVAPVSGETREDFTATDETSGQEFRFVLPGPRLSGPEWARCLETFAHTDARPDIVCASGSLPPGAPDDFYARVAEIVAGWRVRFVLDTSGPALKHALGGAVCLIKPNLRELQDLTGEVLGDETSAIDACRALVHGGRCEMVALTLGAEGALLVTHDRVLRAAALPITPVSTVGAGDSFLGAMVWSLASGAWLEEAFRYGVAAGSAALLAPGTGLCRVEDVNRLAPQVRVEQFRDETEGAARLAAGP